MISGFKLKSPEDIHYYYEEMRETAMKLKWVENMNHLGISEDRLEEIKKWLYHKLWIEELNKHLNYLTIKTTTDYPEYPVECQIKLNTSDTSQWKIF